MIGLVLVTHGRLAEEFVVVVEHIVGAMDGVRAVCIEAEDDVDECRQEIVDAIVETDAGMGVIVLVDMFGGTASNLAISILQKEKVEVIAGINLPLVIKLAGIRETEKLSAAVAAALSSGRQYICVASRILAGKNENQQRNRTL